MTDTTPVQEHTVNSKTTAGFFASRAGYAVLGAGAGFFYGIFSLPDIAKQTKGIAVLGVFAAIIAGGALVGSELHRTRSWDRFGRKGKLARWIVACASAAATIGSVLGVFGQINQTEFWMIVGFGALAGVGFGVRELEDDWRDKASKEALARDTRLRAITVALCLIGLLALWIFT